MSCVLCCISLYDDDDDNTGWADAAGLPRYDDHDDDAVVYLHFPGSTT